MKDLSSLVISPETLIIDAIKAIEAGSRQIALIVDADHRLLGTVTDGDIRRGLLRGVGLDNSVSQVMNLAPLTAKPQQPKEAIVRLMQEREIRQVPIIDEHGTLLWLATLDELLHRKPPDVTVVLMVGGLGTRLRPLTDTIPKPLLHVGGRPLLQTIIENMASQGFTQIYLSVNYKAEMFEEQFGDGSAMGVDIKYIYEDDRMGTAGALSLLPHRPTNPVIVMNGDLLTTLNFQQLLEYHREHRAKATMAVREYSFQVPYGVVETENQRLVSISEKPIHNFFVNAGIYVIEPEAFDLIPQGQPFDMPQLFDAILARSEEASVFPIREYWLDIGRLDDLERAQREYGKFFG